MLLVSCIVLSDGFLDGDRLHSPALILARRIVLKFHEQRTSIDQSEHELSFCINSISRLS